MCGRYTTEIETDERALFQMLLRAEFNTPSLAPGFAAKNRTGKAHTQTAALSLHSARGCEVFPSDIAAVLMLHAGETAPDAHLCRWGYPTEWNGKQRLLINARSESAEEKTLFAESLACRRCVIPTAGFFEWMHNGTKADPHRKFRFNQTGTGLLYLAGLYRPSFVREEQEFVILTREANASMAPIHDRMPVILRPEHVAEYLFSAENAKRLLRETPPVLVKRLVS